jgi:CheY-like chemotaxis protein
MRHSFLVSPATRLPLVLIADSHDDSRGMLATLLSAAGFETAECEGGDGSIDHVKRLSPDVLLLSTSSWGDSIGIVRALNDGNGTSRTPVILITGHGDPEYRQRALEAGCKACLLKPVDVDQLVTELSRLTEHPAVQTASPRLPRHTSADAQLFVRECSTSIEAARVALAQARVVSARAARQVERANRFLARVGRSSSPVKRT